MGCGRGERVVFDGESAGGVAVCQEEGVEGVVEGVGEGGVGVAAVGEGGCGWWWGCEGWFKLLGGCVEGEMLGWCQDRGKGRGLGSWVVVGG